MSKAKAVDEPEIAERPRWLRWLLRSVFGILAVAVLSTPWWGPVTLARLDFFRVRKVQFEGIRFASAPELLGLMALDSTASVWDDLDAYTTRVAKHPMVLTADITRTLPSTVVVTIVERTPVALVPTNGTLNTVDANGNPLPINVAEKVIDAPISTSADSTTLRFLDALRTESPHMYARVIEIRRVAKHELLIQLKGILVRSRDDVTVARLEDILRVEESLAQQNQHAVELDLRFQDQVIVKLP